MDIDVQGGQKIHANDIECEYLFIDAPGIEVLEERLKKRGTETPQVIQKRLTNAQKEIVRGQELEYYSHIVNDNLFKCFQDVVNFIETHYKVAVSK